MLHMKFEIHACSGLREKLIRIDLNARVDVNCGKTDGRSTDGRTENQTPISHLAKAVVEKPYNGSKVLGKTK